MGAKIFIQFFLFICVLATPALAFSANKDSKKSEKISNVEEKKAKNKDSKKSEKTSNVDEEKAKKEKAKQDEEKFRNCQYRKNSRF